MKKISLIIATLVLVGMVNSYSQSSFKNPFHISKFKKEIKNSSVYQSQTRGTTYPHKASVYDWVTGGGDHWELTSVEKYVYNSAGQNIFTYNLASDLSDTFSVDANIFDYYGRNTYSSFEIKDFSGLWMRLFGFRSTITYYDGQKYALKIDEYWDSIKWVIVGKSTYIHNSTGLLTEQIDMEWDMTSQTWVNSVKTEFLYDSKNNNNQIKMYWWEKNNWEKDASAMVYWNKFDPYNMEETQNFDSVIVQEWDPDNNQYANVYKIKVTRDANGGSTITEYMWNNIWEQSFRYTETYDASRNLIGTLEEEWAGDKWEIAYGEEYLLTYVSGNVTEKVSRIREWGGTEYVNNKKYVYSDFNSIKSNPDSKIMIYPNPVEDQLAIDLSGLQDKIINVHLIDLNGKLIKNINLTNTGFDNTVDLSDLNTGVYIISIRSNNLNFSQLLIKR